jgi:DNA gyrase subunit A
MSEGGQIMRTHVDEVSMQGRNTMGVVVMRLGDDDWVASVDTIPAADNEPDGDGGDGS